MYTNLFLAGEPSRVLKVEKAREADPLSTKFLNSKQRISVIPKNKKSIPTNTDEWMSFRREKHFLIGMYSIDLSNSTSLLNYASRKCKERLVFFFIIMDLRLAYIKRHGQ